MTNLQQDQITAKKIFDTLFSEPKTQWSTLLPKITKANPNSNGDTFSKSQLLALYQQIYINQDAYVKKLLKKKPIRTLSGVTPVTVLTKPYPCPGECIFCPVDVRMPKSYITSEPGAQRAAQNGFDPYLQVYNRLQAYLEIGHPVSKIELIVLGGTWSVYPEAYQIWFIKRLFDALNDFSASKDNRPPVPMVDLAAVLPQDTTYNQYVAQNTQYLHDSSQSASWPELYTAHAINESSNSRCVGLVLETRPDYVSKDEVIRLRKLGATKIQIGIQSLSDKVLRLNKRGHSVAETRKALELLRRAGFKIHAHWMPNLYGSNPDQDKTDFDQLFLDSSIHPDELKVYPCSLIEKTELVHIYERGDWQPYTDEQLKQVIDHVLTTTPEYCRLTRIVRDIPSQEILTGNKKTNFRQLVESKTESTKMHDIRAREIKNQTVDSNELFLDDLVYETAVSTEHFLQYITKDRKIAGFLRLSLPKQFSFIPELTDAVIIREIHIYGQSLTVGSDSPGLAQHQGLGKKLITHAVDISKNHHYKKLSVISAIGTRDYYRKQGFQDGDLYQHLWINI